MKDLRNKRKRRNCYHRLRARYIEAQRAHRGNPAASAATQLLAIFAVVIGRAPLLPAQPDNLRYTPPSMSPRHAQRLEIARRLDVPPRYVDVVLSQGTVPVNRLFEDVRRGGVSRRDAIVELRKRMPEASLEWLAYIQKSDRWSELTRCYVSNEREDLTEIRVLESTLRWLEHSKGTTADQPSSILEPTGVDTDPQTPKT